MRKFTNTFTVEQLGDESLNNESITDLSPIENPWDKAHKLKKKHGGKFVEPVFYDEYIAKDLKDNLPPSDDESLDINYCTIDNGYEKAWDEEHPKDSFGLPINKIWHLEDGFSQLLSARNSLSDSVPVVRIAHFDTGYDADHAAIEHIKIRHDLERNFVEGEDPDSAVDTYSDGFLKMPGHGTGTMSILAGNKVNIPQFGHNDSIGIVKNIEIVPLRIAKSVVLIKNDSFIKALEYVISLYDNPETRVHIVTMSMGGAASNAWADAVNRAYEKGIFIVTAAGNNFGRLSPRTLVYPARFNRVVAACGVTFQYKPYYKPFWSGPTLMQGNYGPRKVMKTAIAAFTPNVPWAKFGCKEVVSLAGAGTSSATPQVAAAAALYLQKYFQEIEVLSEGWEKVETIRYALFKSASQKITDFDNDVELYFGNGVIQANKMLGITPQDAIAAGLVKEDEDTVETGVLGLFFQASTDDEAILDEYELKNLDEPSRQMLEVEIAQIIGESYELQALLDNEEKEFEQLTPEEKARFVAIIINYPSTSETLKKVLRSR